MRPHTDESTRSVDFTDMTAAWAMLAPVRSDARDFRHLGVSRERHSEIERIEAIMNRSTHMTVSEFLNTQSQLSIAGRSE